MQGFVHICTWNRLRWAAWLWLQALPVFLASSSPGGEAWPLSSLVHGSPVPLLVKIFTSGSAAYDLLEADLGLQLQLRSTQSIAFEPRHLHCKDVLVDTKGLPAPKSCSTNTDGSVLYLTFYKDQSLRPTTNYFFVVKIRLLAASTTREMRTIYAQTYEEYREVDAFGFVLPSPALPAAGARLSTFEIGTMSSSTLQNSEQFVLLVRLAASSDIDAVDPGLLDSVLIWAMPVTLWDFSSAAPCIVEIGTDIGTGAGTCKFVRFPESESPVAITSFGLNAIELTPAEVISSTMLTFRLRLVAPANGGALRSQSTWYAQARRAGKASDYLHASPFGLTVALTPTATVGRTSNVAVDSFNKVVIVFSTGVTFHGSGAVKIQLPTSFEITKVDVDVIGYSRLGGSGQSLGVPAVSAGLIHVSLPGTASVWDSASYGLQLTLRNPHSAELPPACVDVLSALGKDVMGLKDLARSPFTTGSPMQWSIEVEVGKPVQAAQRVSFNAFHVLPQLKGASIVPSQYGLAVERNTLMVFFTLSLGLLTTDSSIQLSGPTQFEFFCLALAAPAVPLTFFPEIQQCTAAPGLLILDLVPEQFFEHSSPLSFSVAVKNPSEPAALQLEEQIQLSSRSGSMPAPHPYSLLSSNTAWALLLTARGVACQAQVELQSPYKTPSWQLFQRPLLIDSLTTTSTDPGQEAIVNSRFRFSSRVPAGATLTILAPFGFRFAASIDVQAGSTGASETLPVEKVIRDQAKPHIVALLLSSSTRRLTTYGIRATMENSAVSPGAQEEPSPNLWSFQAKLPAGAGNLSARFDAGNIEGYQLSSLQDCEVQASVLAFGFENQLTVSFIVHRSLYSTGASMGSIQVQAPEGYVVDQLCYVEPPLSTLDVAQGTRSGESFRFFGVSRCQGIGSRIVVTIDQSSAILQGSHVRFQVSVNNPSSVPLSTTWEITTFQGFDKQEECEETVRTFKLTRPLVRASYEAGGVGEDLRPGMRSVYRFSFVYPERTSDEEADISRSSKPQSTIKLTVPEGFKVPAICMVGASGTNVLEDALPLPEIISCIGDGRHAQLVLDAVIQPLQLYAFGITILNPSSSFPYSPAKARWLLQVDEASDGSMQRPSIRLLSDTALIPGDLSEWRPSYSGQGHWTKILFRIATDVVKGGGIGVLVPYFFKVGHCGASTYGLFETSSDSAIGGAEVAPGTPCVSTQGISSGQRHRVLLFPLTAPLVANSRYLLALLIKNSAYVDHQADPSGWSVYTTDTDGEILDMSNMIPSFHVDHALGAVTFLAPALSVQAGSPYLVDATFTLKTTIRRGAVLFYPPPSVRVRCDQFFSSSNLPRQSECAVEGVPAEWLSHRMVLRSLYFPWSANRLYGLRIEVFDVGYQLPYYRRSWMIRLIGGLQAGSNALTGFSVSSTAVEQWRWRGLLQHVSVRNDNPALYRRYNTYIDLSTLSALSTTDSELWVRPPPGIIAHPFTCRRILESSQEAVETQTRMIPVFCEVLKPPKPCTPFVWETDPCTDAIHDVVVTSHEFAHRSGLRVFIGVVPAGSFIRLSVATTPDIDFFSPGVQQESNTWTVSTWEGRLELDVAQTKGYMVHNWIDVTRFYPSSITPEAHIYITIEWWMFVALPAKGRIFIRPPSYGSARLMHDLSRGAEEFDAGNLPTHAPGQSEPVPPTVEAYATQLEITVCCELHGYTRYHFRFGCTNPPFQRMPAPSLVELNTWSILTSLPSASGTFYHQQIIQGYSLARPFQEASVAQHTERKIGGVGAADLLGKIQVAIDFMVPFATALHGPAAELRLLAPLGWEFPGNCILENVQLGPYTKVDNCRATDRELVLVISGDINPGVENTVFGFVVAVQPPTCTALNDIWILQAFAPVGSSEALVDDNVPEGGEIELRLSSTVIGMARPSDSGAYDSSLSGSTLEIIAQVDLVPRHPGSLYNSWRPPAELLGVIKFRLPKSMETDLPNATLRVTAPVDLKLRCTFPPEPFLAGTLPPGILCFDWQTSGADLNAVHQIDRPYQVVIAVHDLIPLRPMVLYNFTIAVQAPGAPLTHPPLHSRWPRGTAWKLVLVAGSAQFRTVVASTSEIEGVALPSAAIRDIGVLTSTTKASTLVEVMLVFAVPSKLLLPVSIEVRPPVTFQLDSAPSPLHPALQPQHAGFNPFKSVGWQERAKLEAKQASDLVSAGDELIGKPCPFFELLISDPAEQVVALPPEAYPNGSFCEAPPTLESSLLHSCRTDTYKALPAALARCHVMDGTAIIRLHRRALSTFRSPKERDENYCERLGCEDRFDHAWLPDAQYRLTLRGFNPPLPLPEGTRDSSNIWSLTVSREVRELGGGPRSTIDPSLAAQVPGYRIDAAPEYSDPISPTIGKPLRGGVEWYDDLTPIPGMPVSLAGM